MKISLFIGLLMLVGQAFGQSKAESEVLALSKQKFDWMTTGNIDAVNDLMADKAVINHANGRVQTKTEYINDLKSKRLVYKTIDTKDITVRIVGETAIVLGSCTITITFNGTERPPFNFAFEEVYAQENNKWKLAMYSVKNNSQ